MSHSLLTELVTFFLKHVGFFKSCCEAQQIKSLNHLFFNLFIQVDFVSRATFRLLGTQSFAVISSFKKVETVSFLVLPF